MAQERVVGLLDRLVLLLLLCRLTVSGGRCVYMLLLLDKLLQFVAVNALQLLMDGLVLETA